MVSAPTSRSMTPWGVVQDRSEIASGIVFVGTASHGGFWLSPDRLAILRANLPWLDRTFSGFPWFEEDCDAAYVMVAFPEYFDSETRANAERMIDWHRALKARNA